MTWFLNHCLKWMMLAIYILATAFILWRSISCIKKANPNLDNKRNHIILILIFIIMDATLIIAKFLPYGTTRTFFHYVGNRWLGFLILLLTFIIFADILLLILKGINRKKELEILKRKAFYAVVAISVFALSLGCTVYGCIHATTVCTSSYDITIQKDCTIKDLNIVLIGDLHLGYNVGEELTQKMVDAVNEMNPDLIIFAGDAFDNEYEAVENPDKIIEILKTLKSKYGVWATWGNHDVVETLVGGFPIDTGDGCLRDERMTQFIEDCGFHILDDETALVADSFYLIGRRDTERPGDGTRTRATIESLTEGLDASKPWIVINHEPDEMQQTADAGVDMSVSGHTHAGQFFPLTIVQPFRWANHWGYKQFDNMASFTTSGVGVYGPPLRIATNCEVMQIQVHFEK